MSTELCPHATYRALPPYYISSTAPILHNLSMLLKPCGGTAVRILTEQLFFFIIRRDCLSGRHFSLTERLFFHHQARLSIWWAFLNRDGTWPFAPSRLPLRFFSFFLLHFSFLFFLILMVRDHSRPAIASSVFFFLFFCLDGVWHLAPPIHQTEASNSYNLTQSYHVTHITSYTIYITSLI